tara:strand:- start:1812 stop:2066 length:255 start_codon:yes stop_codon:yes gene_type:complete
MNPSPKTTVTVDAHDAFHKSLVPQTHIEKIWGGYDEIDCEVEHLAASAPPNPRAGKDVDRVLSILDELQVEELRSLNFEEKGAR